MPPEFISESALWGPLYALGVFGAFLLVALFVHLAFRIVLPRRIAADPKALTTQVLGDIRGPVVVLIVFLGLVLGFIVLTGLTHSAFDVFNGMDMWARKALVVLLIGDVSLVASRLTQDLLTWYVHIVGTRTARRVEAKLLPPFKRVLPIVIYSIGALMILDSLGVAISPMLAGIGIGGLAVALAVQPTLSNFLAGTFLVTEGEFRPGDFIELEGGPSGFVMDVGWRSTKIRSRFNNVVLIPNSRMVESIVTNFYSPTPALNVIVDCGVSYDSDLAHVEKVVLEVTERLIAESEHAVKDAEPFFGFSEFGDSNIDFFVFLQANDRIGSFWLKSEAIKRIHARFAEEGIEINYPVRKLVHTTTDGVSPRLHAQEE